MKLEQIEVIIDTNGKIRLQTSGFSGDECLAATQKLEELLGNQLVQRERTSETYDGIHGKTSERQKIFGAK